MAMGRGIRFARAFIELTLDATKSAKSLRRFRAQLNSVGRIAGGVSTAMGTIATVMARITIESVKAAAAAQDVANRFDVAFGRRGQMKMQQFISSMNRLGPGREALKAIAADAALVVKPMGATAATTEWFSKQMTQLSIDLASFRDKRPEEVFARISSSLMGNTEAVRALGIVFTEAEVKARMLQEGMDPEKATQLQKAIARFELIRERAAPAMGDLARTQRDWNNQVREFQGKYQDNMAQLGREILPDLAKGLNQVNAAMDAAGPIMEKYMGGMAGLADLTQAGLGTDTSEDLRDALDDEIRAREARAKGDFMGRAFSNAKQFMRGLRPGGSATTALQGMPYETLVSLRRSLDKVDRENERESRRPPPDDRPVGAIAAAGRAIMPNFGFQTRANFAGMALNVRDRAQAAMRRAADAMAPQPQTTISHRSMSARGAMFSGVSKTMEIDIEKAQLTVLQDIREILRNGGVVFN